MSHRPAHNTSLSRSARLACYLGPPSAILLTAIASPRTALLAPLAFLPTAWFYHRWRRSNKLNPARRGALEPMVWIYASCGTLGLAAVAVVQTIAGYATTFLLFGPSQSREDFVTEALRSTVDDLTPSQLARRAQLASTWQNWVFMLLFSFLMAGLLEESLKYLPIAYARRQPPSRKRHPRNSYLDYTLAGALSFGVVEGIGSLHAAVEQGHESWARLLLTLFERVVLGSTGHVLVALLTALRAIRRDAYGDRLGWWGVVGPAVLWHGTYDFFAFSFSALEGNVGWIHPTGVWRVAAMVSGAFAMVATVGWRVRSEWRALDERDRRRE